MDTTQPTEMVEQNTSRDQQVTRSLKLLREGFKGELEEFIYTDPRFTELMMDSGQDLLLKSNIHIIHINCYLFSFAKIYGAAAVHFS